MRFPPPGSAQPLPRQNVHLLPPGAGAAVFDPTGPGTVPNNIINALFSCAASEIEQQKIIDAYWQTFTPPVRSGK
jgi:hypothetical protein